MSAEHKPVSAGLARFIVNETAERFPCEIGDLPVDFIFEDKGLLAEGAIGYTDNMLEMSVIVDDGGIHTRKVVPVDFEDLCEVVYAIEHERVHFGQQEVFWGLAEHEHAEELFLDWLAYKDNPEYCREMYPNNVCECEAILKAVPATVEYLQHWFEKEDIERALLNRFNGNQVPRGFCGEENKSTEYESIEAFLDDVASHMQSVLEDKPKYVYFNSSEDAIYGFTTLSAPGDVKGSREFRNAWMSEKSTGWDKGRMMTAYNIARDLSYRKMHMSNVASFDVCGLDAYASARESMVAAVRARAEQLDSMPVWGEIKGDDGYGLG